MSAITPPPPPLRARARALVQIPRAAKVARALGAKIGARDGVVVVEFALIVPFLLALYVGGAEYCRAMMNSHAVVHLARTVADLTSLGGPEVDKPIPTTLMQDIFKAAPLVLRPFDSSVATVKVSAIGIYMKGRTRTVQICSSAALNTQARTVGVAPADLVIPEGYSLNGMRLVVAEVTMPYQPVMGAAFTRLTRTTIIDPLTATIIWPTRGGMAFEGDPEVIVPDLAGGTTAKACPKPT